MKQHRFNLHLPGLLKVLAEHLYSTKKVSVRELIQNAHDSCVRRKIEGGEVGYRPRIELAIDADRRMLTIRDNGCGLTADEIRTYLATIGRGYTRELREKLAFCDSLEGAELVGEFGLGFLSAFLIASEVVLTTRSFRGEPALRWCSSGDEYYETTPGSRDEVGTTIELTVKPTASFLLRKTELINSVRGYADFLATPIFLDGEPGPLNRQAPPWEDAAPDVAIRKHIGQTFQGVQPLYVLRLHDGTVQVPDGTFRVPLQGYLFVPPGSVASVREYGDLTVFIRRMFICDREQELLPAWARFVRGVIDCPLLQPTASREGVHQDENFELVQQVLMEQLLQGLRRLALDDPHTWRRLVQGHSDVITSWAVKDSEFFEQVQNLVVFRTTRGLLSLPEYLLQSGGTIYYVTRQLGSLQEQLLAEGHDVPAIDASWFAVAPFLETYALRHPDVDLVQLDARPEAFLRPVAKEKFAALLDCFRDQSVCADVAAFRPVDLPAIVLYPEGAEIVRDARAALDDGELSAGLAGLVEAFVERKDEAADSHGRFFLNASCPLVCRLAEETGLASCRRDVLMMLYQIARLFAGRMLSPADAVSAFRDINRSIEGLVQR